MNPRARFMNACRGNPVDRPPVWLMRQAGRILPEYRSLRNRHSFWSICTTPELAAEATLQPIRRLGVDAAILFSDILILPEALGWRVDFRDRPRLVPPANGLDSLRTVPAGRVLERLACTCQALRLVRRSLGEDRPLLGFAGAPFTLAYYMLTGGGHDEQPVRTAMARRPAAFMRWLLTLASLAADHLALQVEASADAVQIFDSRAGILTPAEFRQFAMPAVSYICRRFAALQVPVIYYADGSARLLAELARCGATVLGLDERTDLAAARAMCGPRTALQGNLDPKILLDEPEKIRRQVFRMLDATQGRGHIVNLGRGVLPDTPLAGVEAFIAAVHAWQEVRSHE